MLSALTTWGLEQWDGENDEVQLKVDLRRRMLDHKEVGRITDRV